MKRFFTILIGIGLILGGGIWGYMASHREAWEKAALEIADMVGAAPFEKTTWEAALAKAEEELPSFAPFEDFAHILRDVVALWPLYEERPEFVLDAEEARIPYAVWKEWDTYGTGLHKHLSSLYQSVEALPVELIPEAHQALWETHKGRLFSLERLRQDLEVVQQSLREAFDRQESVLVLLQNQNEPRPTGGFGGSFLWIDFADQGIQWRFSDIYALDRQVPEKGQKSAPEFFHDLSKTISLRDANLYPHFPRSGENYFDLIAATGEKAPRTMVAINLNVVRSLLELTGDIDLPEWGVTLSADHFDLVLQFLVESKIAGRYAVKAPVDAFAQKLLQKLLAIDFSEASPWIALTEKWKANKDLLLYSRRADLQEVIDRYGWGGLVAFDPSADDFLYADFVSVGANKSEKFVWTKFSHQSEIRPEGVVRNTLNIKRTHTATQESLQQFLGMEDWSPNVASLLDGELSWKLGMGENRTILRLLVPPGSQLQTPEAPSGPIGITQDQTNVPYAVWEVPLFVLPGETLEFDIVYEVPLRQGNAVWRPYFFELLGTPGRDEKTMFRKTIGSSQAALFEGMSSGLGTWGRLWDGTYRANVKFR